ncbi:hypothetical protein [Corynebacterium sp. LK2510]|uniref:hypothetical protein n=1 Tax=Corynebacterium sp. LK2510 TaxID=3110472 RepID=UPI0034CDFDD8
MCAQASYQLFFAFAHVAGVLAFRRLPVGIPDHDHMRLGSSPTAARKNAAHLRWTAMSAVLASD